MDTQVQTKRIVDSETGCVVGFYVNGSDFLLSDPEHIPVLVQQGLIEWVDGLLGSLPMVTPYGMGLPVKRGRRRVYQSASERQAAYLERHQLEQVTVTLPKDVRDALASYMERQARDGSAMTQSEVITKLLRTQLLRKR